MTDLNDSSPTVTRRHALATAGLTLAALGLAGEAGAQPRPMTAEEKTNLTVIDDFLAAMNAKGADTVMSIFAPDARFTAGPMGKFAPLRAPGPIFTSFIGRAKSMKMTVKPGTTQAHGAFVTHERVDEMVLQDGSTSGSGTFFAVFALRDGKIVDFIDFQLA